MRNAIGILFTLAMLGSPCLAQGSLVPGARVRTIQLDRDDPRRVGRIVTATSDSATVAFEPNSDFMLAAFTGAIPRARLEVLTSSRRYAGRGALIGMLLGATSGLIVGAQLSEHQCHGSGSNPTGRYCELPDHTAQKVLTPLGAVLGTGVGALIGVAIKTEKWSPAFSAGTQGATISLSRRTP